MEIADAGMAQVEEAVKSFATLAGPFINGYAFCDMARQRELRAKALDWVESHPYGAIFMERFPAKPGDRTENLKASIRGVRADATKERAHFEDPKTVEAFYAARKQNGMDEKFCWK